jgi:cytochrome c-type biogenesis protein CcmH/NrfF
MWSLRRASLAVVLLALTGWAHGDAQTVTQGDDMYLRMREVGSHLRCQCEGPGGCSYTVANCNMLHCSFRERVNPEIRKALEAGIGPDAVVAAMIAKFGSELRTEPLPHGFGLLGWAMPFAALAVGLMIVPFVVRRWKRQQSLTPPEAHPIDERVLAEYEAAIERDLAESE